MNVVQINNYTCNATDFCYVGLQGAHPHDLIIHLIVMTKVESYEGDFSEGLHYYTSIGMYNYWNL